MSALFGWSWPAALVVLRCPRCGHRQARARADPGTTYDCRACGHELRRPDDEDAADDA